MLLQAWEHVVLFAVLSINIESHLDIPRDPSVENQTGIFTAVMYLGCVCVCGV